MIGRKILMFVVIMAAVGAVQAGIWFHTGYEALPVDAGELPLVEELSEEEAGEPDSTRVDSYPQIYEVGKWLLTQERMDYVSGEMILEVPRMNFSGPVYAGPVSEDTLEQGSGSVSDETLELGVGLFGLSQMPSEGNANVCIAGHRDVHGEEFYDIDQVGEGDLLYLIYKGKRYTYEFYEQQITEPTDWSMIRTRDFSSLTLQSCDPVGVASHRIFVIGKLIEITDEP